MNRETKKFAGQAMDLKFFDELKKSNPKLAAFYLAQSLARWVTRSRNYDAKSLCIFCELLTGAEFTMADLNDARGLAKNFPMDKWPIKGHDAPCFIPASRTSTYAQSQEKARSWWETAEELADLTRNLETHQKIRESLDSLKTLRVPGELYADRIIEKLATGLSALINKAGSQSEDSMKQIDTLQASVERLRTAIAKWQL